MKKLLLLLLSSLILSSCSESNAIIGLKKGDKRVTITQHYIYIEECVGVTNLNHNATWKYERIINRDSIGQRIYIEGL